MMTDGSFNVNESWRLPVAFAKLSLNTLIY